jgi:hypothetical protein
MIHITISDTFTKGQIVRQPVRCRTSNKEKSDLSPLNRSELKPIIGQSKGCVIVSRGQIKGISLVRRDLSDIEGYTLRKRLNHSFIGSYSFERLDSKTEKSLKRDLMALVLQKAKQIKVEIAKDGKVIAVFEHSNCNNYQLAFNKVKQAILRNRIQRINNPY